jgi:NAD(P)-dependent dehydrogenase (short-subunit alcohol dehydrogenase family)
MSLSGKVFAVTGGASGIGLATSKLLASRGATVCIADVDPEAMKNAEEHFSSASPNNYSITKVDVSQRREVDAWIDGVVEKFGRLDGAANIAGVIGKYHGKREVSDLDDDDWNRIIGVNLTGTMYCLRAELRKIVDGGSIVNISSIHGLKGWRPQQSLLSSESLS